MGSLLDHVTTRALLRSRRWQRALRRVNKSLLVGYRDGSDLDRPFTDLAVASRNGLTIRVDDAGRDPQYRVRVPGRIEIPRQVRLNASVLGSGQARSLFREVREAVAAGSGYDEHRVGGDEVMGVLLPSKREVLIPGLTNRIVHALVVDALTPMFTMSAPSRLYSYLPDRSRYHALHHARAFIAEGRHFAMRFDIEKYFPSTSIDLVDTALDAELPEIADDLRSLIRWLHDVNIVRRRTHRGVRAGTVPAWQPPLRALMQGTALAAPLSNVVGTHVLDRPFLAEFADASVVLLRYADDGLILGPSPSAVADALRLVDDLLGTHNLWLHPDPAKTSSAPVDLRRDAVRWLGKDIDVGGVTTPSEKVLKRLIRMVRTTPGSHAQRSLAREVLKDLILDPASALARAEETLLVDAPEWLPTFRGARKPWARERNRLLNLYNLEFN